MFVCVCHHGRGKSCDLRRQRARVLLAKSLSLCQAVEAVRRSGPSQASCLDNTPPVLICVREVIWKPGAFQSPTRGKIFNFFTRFPSFYKWEGRVLIRDMFYLIADCDGAEAAQKHLVCETKPSGATALRVPEDHLYFSLTPGTTRDASDATNLHVYVTLFCVLLWLLFCWIKCEQSTNNYLTKFISLNHQWFISVY